MPFFRKKRPTSLTHEQPSTNVRSTVCSEARTDCDRFISNRRCSGSVGSSKAGTPTLNHVLPALPPLQNFIPPADKSAQIALKSKPRNTSNIEEVLVWGREYFSLFLRSEEVEEILEIWDRIGAIKKEGSEKDYMKSWRETPLDNEILRLKFQIEKSTFAIDLNVLNCEENENNVYRWIVKCYDLISQALQDDYLPRFLDSKFYIRCQVDFFTSTDAVNLHDILRNHSALFYFMEYVDQESKREVLEFWLGATNFAEQFVSRSYSQNEDSPIDVRVAQSDAMVLYEKYISLQAPQILGFRDEIRSDVERLICSQDEIAHCFDKAINEAFLYLHVTCLDGFLKSSLFLAFLTDLINSLGPSLKTHKRSGVAYRIRDCTSFLYVHIPESTSTCSSSSASLTSPVAHNNVSSLHQSGKSKLCLGRVNSMGKFEADTDLELLKHESGIAKTMKKLVNFDEKEKAKEELAWQVAAMIVNEVTSITMGTGDSSNVAQ